MRSFVYVAFFLAAGVPLLQKLMILTVLWCLLTLALFSPLLICSCRCQPGRVSTHSLRVVSPHVSTQWLTFLSGQTSCAVYQQRQPAIGQPRLAIGQLHERDAVGHIREPLRERLLQPAIQPGRPGLPARPWPVGSDARLSRWRRYVPIHRLELR